MPKPSIEKGEPHVFQSFHLLDGVRHVVDHHARSSELEAPGIDARLVEDPLHQVDEVGLMNCRALTLTASNTDDGMVGFSHSHNFCMHVSSTQVPIGRIRPVSSASGMKSAGGTVPRTDVPSAAAFRPTIRR